MSKYTTEVRFICETYSGLTESKGYSSANEIIDSAIPKIFDFDFPIFDENYRKVLEHKILKHYYTREIGVETVGLWKLMLDTKLNEIMPYYNQLYKSELYEFNPFYDVDLTREHKGDSTQNKNGSSSGEGSGSSSGSENEDESGNRNTSGREDTNTSSSQHVSGSDSSDRKQVYSDTPQGSISNLEDNTYLTNATLNDDSGKHNEDTSGNGTQAVTRSGNEGYSNTKGKSSSESNKYSNKSSEKVDVTSTDSYIETVKGKQGGQNYSELLIKFRKTFLNIDMQVIDELEELFFGLW